MSIPSNGNISFNDIWITILVGMVAGILTGVLIEIFKHIVIETSPPNTPRPRIKVGPAALVVGILVACLFALIRFSPSSTPPTTATATSIASLTQEVTPLNALGPSPTNTIPSILTLEASPTLLLGAVTTTPSTVVLLDSTVTLAVPTDTATPQPSNTPLPTDTSVPILPTSTPTQIPTHTPLPATPVVISACPPDTVSTLGKGNNKQYEVTMYKGCYYHFNVACNGCAQSVENNYVVRHTGDTVAVTIAEGQVWQYGREPNQGEVCRDELDHWPVKLPAFLDLSGVQQLFPCGVR